MAYTRLDPACIVCLLKKHLTAVPEGTDRETQVRYMQRVMEMIAKASPLEGAPVLVSQIGALKKEMFGVEQDFEEEKRRFNELMLSMEETIWHRICAQEDALYAAVRYAMIGNYIDFGAMENVDEDALAAMLADSGRFVPQAEAYEAFRRDVLSMKRLVYLTDNCGEIVMDKLLLRVMHQMNPQAELTVIVRGERVLNDATQQEARFVRLDEHARLLGNGSAIAGTCLRDISAQARAEIEAADVIISKGQANFETLRRCGMNVYYIFLCKCELFASRFGVERYQGMLLRDADS